MEQKNNIPSKNKFRLKDKALISASFGLFALGTVWTCHQIKNKKFPTWPLMVCSAGNLAIGCSIVKARENAKQK
ncbi:MAG: hypothetical protein E7021_05060 [Alphaproteobacteria bacterium]|nr:hypothetical protein [Alphaproteobacteria bacterium]